MKKRSWFWFILQLFPLIIIALFFISRIGQGTAQFETLNDIIIQMKTFTENFKMGDITNMFEDFLYRFGLPADGRRILASLVSYELSLLLLRLAYEVIAFLPKFCISVFERKKGE